MLPTGWQDQHLRSAESTAGPRFDSGLDVDLDFSRIFDGFGRTKRYRDTLAAIGNKLAAAFSQSVDADTSEELPIVEEATKLVSSALLEASSTPPESIVEVERIVEVSRRGLEAAWELRSRHVNRESAESEHKISDYTLHQVNKAADLLSEAIDLCEATMTVAANRRLLLLTGSAGSGKTHLLLHVARERAVDGLATIVLFGDRFSGLDHVRDFGARLGLSERYTLTEILSELEAVGASSGTRALLLVDAINETIPCGLWQNGLRWLEGAVADYPHVCVALSVRTGFEDAAVDAEFLERVMRIEHPGFSQNLWDAVRAFFTHYRVQWPEIPLLGPEFTNPLFLKLFCIAFSGEKPRDFRGHQGGTHIFEVYAKKVGPSISGELGVRRASPQFVWTNLVKPIATWMGEHGAQEIPFEDALAVAEAAFPGMGREALALAEKHALLTKAPRFGRDREVSHYVLRFSYQKFSDHLIVRFLLNRHFEPLAKEPEKAFEADTPLGRIARLEGGQGLLEALAAQIPERTNGEHELTDFVPTGVAVKRQMSSAFLDSLIWRKPDALGQPAIDYINAVILKKRGLLEELFEVLLSVASVPDYRLNAKALHNLLDGWSLPDRDRWWTGWLRHRYANEGTAVDRLISWARRAPGRERVQSEAALLTAIALSWLFVSPSRFLRDDATKATVALLEHHPAVVPELLTVFDSVNDPYVIERVYCAALGALTRNPDVGALAASSRVLLDGFFSRRDNTHLLTRDYARGIVELALRAGVINETEGAVSRPPYNAAFPMDVPNKEELKSRFAGAEGYVREYGSIWHSVMEWDFGWYVIGTNAGSTPWSNRRIGEQRPPTVADRWERFEEGLDGDARDAYRAWRDSRIDSFLNWVADLREQGDQGDQEGESRRLRGEKELRRLLTPEQTVEFKDLLAANEQPVPDDKFDLAIEQSWVFLRCLELGWTEERFGAVDAGSVRSRSDTRKIERIGKKYEWIAHYEFLGLLADNFALEDRWGGSQSPEYHGPWIGYFRDIDPTCLADGLVHGVAPVWCELPTYDPEATECDDAGWLATVDDLIDPVAAIELRDDSGDTWLSLEGSHEWRRPLAPGIEEYSSLHRRFWCQIQAYLVSVDRADEFLEWAVKQNFMGRWMPESHPFSEVYLREYPDSQAFGDLVTEPESERSGWITEAERGELKVPVLVASDGYTGSSADRDCSVKESFNVYLPPLALVRGLGLSHDEMDGTWTSNGIVVAFDPSVDTDAAGRLLVRQAALKSYLAEQGLTVVWTVLAAKEMSGGWNDQGRLHRTDISGAYVLGPEGVNGSLWVTREQEGRMAGE